MSGQLTTHVLDTANGVPAADMRIELYAADGDDSRLADVRTDTNGRCAEPLLAGAAFRPGRYELRFHVGPYFAARGAAGPAFLDVVPVCFTLSDADAHYHIPLLVSPWSYTTYRGS